MFSLNWMQKPFEPLYLLSLSFLLPFFVSPLFLLINKPLLLTSRKKKQTYNISDICETENSARPSRNTVGMFGLQGFGKQNGFAQTSVNVIDLHKNENINDYTIK